MNVKKKNCYKNCYIYAIILIVKIFYPIIENLYIQQLNEFQRERIDTKKSCEIIFVFMSYIF